MKNKNKHRRVLQALLLLVALLFVLPGQRIKADELAGCAEHYRHIDWETTTPAVCIWATDVVLTATQVAQGQTDGTLQQTVLDAANPVVNYYPNPNGYRDVGSGLFITAADLSAVSATVAEGEDFEQYTVRLMMDSSKPDERYIKIMLTVLADHTPCTATSLELQQPPTKTQYLVGEQFDATGMVVIAHYTDETQKEVTTQLTLSPAGPLALGDTQVMLAYGSLSLAVPVTVENPPVLVSIAVTTPPDQLNYVSGTQFDPTGMLVTGYYSDGSSALLEYTLQGDLTITAQSHTIVIEAGGLTTEFAAGVLQPTFTPPPSPIPTAVPAPVLPAVPALPAPTPIPTPTLTPTPTPTASPSPQPSPTAAPPSAPPPSTPPVQDGQPLQVPPAAQGDLLQVKPHEVLFGLSAGSVAGFSALLAPDVYVLLWYQHKKNHYRRRP